MTATTDRSTRRREYDRKRRKRIDGAQIDGERNQACAECGAVFIRQAGVDGEVRLHCRCPRPRSEKSILNAPSQEQIAERCRMIRERRGFLGGSEA